jgi:uncharacterized protein YceK
MRIRLAFCALALVTFSGCGTAANLISPCHGAPGAVYGGVRADLSRIGNGSPGDAIAGVIDLPFSAVGDTLTLPLTVRAQASRSAAPK